MNRQTKYKEYVNNQIGKTYNSLTILEICEKRDKENRVQAICRCVCGNEKSIQLRRVISGNTKSCGCGSGCNYSHNKIDMSCKIIGRLTVLYKEGTIRGKIAWRCKCECGNETIVIGTYLRNGNTKSCGCLNLERVKTHDKSNTKLYNIWKGIRRRCSDKKGKWSHLYIGKGITVCDEWNNSFQEFYDWSIANGYKQGLSIDRINGNKGYYPSNCRWVTSKEQSRNTCLNIVYNGEYAIDAARRLGAASNIICLRLKAGWTLEEAFTTPKGHTSKQRKPTH